MCNVTATVGLANVYLRRRLRGGPPTPVSIYPGIFFLLFNLFLFALGQYPINVSKKLHSCGWIEEKDNKDLS